MKCHYGACKEEGYIKLYGGELMCNKHALDYYRFGDINKACAEFAQNMELLGIKRGSWKWGIENVRFLKNILGKKRVKNNWKDTYMRGGVLGVIKAFIIFHFLT